MLKSNRMNGLKNTPKENNSSSTVLLSLGTNLEPKLQHLQKACDLLQKLGSVTSVSSVYESDSWGFEAPSFFNVCVLFQTTKNMTDLLTSCQMIEKQLGRIQKTESNQYTSRPMDIDLIFNDQNEINIDQLTIPHYLFHKRKFVLLPAVEIMSDFIPPKFDKNLTQILAICEDSGSCVKTKLKIVL